MRFWFTLLGIGWVFFSFGQTDTDLYKDIHFFKTSQLDSVLQSFDDQSPDWLPNLWHLRAFLKQEKFEEAKKCLSSFPENDAEVIYEWSKYYALQYRVDSSLFFLNLYLKKRDRKLKLNIINDPDFDPIRITNQWKLFWKERQTRKSEELYAQLQLFIQSKNYLDVLDRIAVLDKKTGQNPKVLNYEAMAYSGLGSLKLAEKKYDKLQSSIRTDDYYYAVGVNALSLKKYSKAKQFFELIRVVDTSNYQSLKYNMLFDYMNTQTLPSETLVSVFKLSNNLDDYRMVIDHYYEKKEYDLVLYWCNLAIENTTLVPGWLYFKRAECYNALMKYKEAMKDLNTCLDLIQDKKEVYYLRGWVYLRLGNYQVACKDWERSLRKGYLKARKPLNEFCK